MNTAHWHLALNHVPLIGTIIGTFILTAGIVLKKNESIKRTGLSVLILSALFAIPVYLTGEGAEELVEKMPGVTDGIIEKHESSGKVFMIFLEILGILSLITFIADWTKKRISSLLYAIVFFIALGLSILGKQVGSSGGEIRHTEIRNQTSPQEEDQSKLNIDSEKEED